MMTDRHEAECARVEASFTETTMDPKERAIRLEVLRLGIAPQDMQTYMNFIRAVGDPNERLECVRAARSSHCYRVDDVLALAARYWDALEDKAA